VRQDRARVMADVTNPSECMHAHQHRAARRITPRTAATSIQHRVRPTRHRRTHPHHQASTGTRHVATLRIWPLCVVADSTSIGNKHAALRRRTHSAGKPIAPGSWDRNPRHCARPWRAVLDHGPVSRPASLADAPPQTAQSHRATPVTLPSCPATSTIPPESLSPHRSPGSS
jgi:hypothetical protein